MAEHVIGKLPLNARQLKTHWRKIQIVVARGTVDPKNHSLIAYLKTEWYSVDSVFAKSRCATKTSKGPLNKKMPRPLKYHPFLTRSANKVYEGQNLEDEEPRNLQLIPSLPGLLFSKTRFSIIN